MLAALAAAGQISGTVMPGDDGQGALVLLTALGTLSIKNAIALAAGTRLVLQPLPDRPGAVLVVAVNDVATSPRTAPAAALPSAAPAPALPPPALLDLGTTITATVLAPGGEPSAQPDAPPAPMASPAPSLPVAPSRAGELPAAAAAALTAAPAAPPLVNGPPHAPAPAGAARSAALKSRPGRCRACRRHRRRVGRPLCRRRGRRRLSARQPTRRRHPSRAKLRVRCRRGPTSRCGSSPSSPHRRRKARPSRR